MQVNTIPPASRTKPSGMYYLGRPADMYAHRYRRGAQSTRRFTSV
jgi:hypothetical protein